jgi:hypothetical protein
MHTFVVRVVGHETIKLSQLLFGEIIWRIDETATFASRVGEEGGV